MTSTTADDGPFASLRQGSLVRGAESRAGRGPNGGRLLARSQPLSPLLSSPGAALGARRDGGSVSGPELRPRGGGSTAPAGSAAEGKRSRAAARRPPPRAAACGPAPPAPNIRVPVRRRRAAAARSASQGGGGARRRRRRWRRRWGEPAPSLPLPPGSVRSAVFLLLHPLLQPRPTTTRSCGPAAMRTMGRTSGNRPPRPAAGEPAAPRPLPPSRRLLALLRRRGGRRAG